MSIMTVARHDVPFEYARRQVDALSRSVPGLIDIVQENPDALKSTWSRVRTILAHRGVLGPAASEPETWA